MKFPILGVSSASPSTSAANFMGPATASIGWISAENRIQTPVSENCSLTEFIVKLNTAPGEGKKWVFTVRKNGAATEATVTIEGVATSATFKGSVAFSAADLVSIESTPTGTPTETAAVSTCVYFQTTGNIGFIMGGGSTNVSATETNFNGPYGTTAWNAAEANIRVLVPTGGTFTKLVAASPEGSPGTGKAYALSGRVAGTTDFLTATVEGEATKATTTGSQAVTAGEAFAIKCVPASTPTARKLYFCLSFEPTVSGEVFVGYGSNASGSTSTTEYVPPRGNTAWSSAEPTAPLPPVLRLRKFYVAIGTVPGAAKSRTFAILSNGSATAASVKLEGASETAGHYTGADVLTTVEKALVVRTVPASTPAVNTGGTHFGFVIAVEAPSVESKAAASVEKTKATLKSTVNPEGASTTYKFEYGKTEALGSSTSGGSAAEGTSAIEKTEALEGLEANTKYFFRVSATNGTGTTQGTILNFTTEASGTGPPVGTLGMMGVGR